MQERNGARAQRVTSSANKLRYPSSLDFGNRGNRVNDDLSSLNSADGRAVFTLSDEWHVIRAVCSSFERIHAGIRTDRAQFSRVCDPLAPWDSTRTKRD